MGIPLKLMQPRDQYVHGWGKECLDPKPVVCTWQLTVLDCNSQPCTLYFDLVNGSSPLVIGLDVSRYSDSVNLTNKPHIRIKRPQDVTTYKFSTYIAPESDENPDCIRIRVKLLPKPPRYISSMMSKLVKLAQNNPIRFAKRVHRYTHVHPDQLKHVCDSAGILYQDLKHAIDSIDASCEICVRNGRPLPSKKISLSQVNEAFNQEVQVDFKYIVIHRRDKDHPDTLRREKYVLLILTDTGTKYTESAIVRQRNIRTIIQVYDQYWLYRHGASRHVSADDEYHERTLTSYFESHDVTFKARPTRRHNKLGIVERKNGTLESIIKRLALDFSDAPIETLIARGTFLCNLFAGSQILSAFELARGYRPSLLGIPTTMVTPELLQAHTSQAATRALQRILRSRTPNIPTPGMFNKGDIAWVWYASTKNNDDNMWIKAIVEATHPHYLEVRRLRNGKPCKGPTMKPAYEDIRVAPRDELAQQLMECRLETELGQIDDAQDTVTTDTDAHSDQEEPAISTLMTGIKPPKTAYDDIGPYAAGAQQSKDDIETTLTSDREHVIESIYQTFGSQQLSRGKLSSAPPWILDESFIQEYQSNWADPYELVDERDAPPDANIITSHSVYKVKTAENGSRQIKTRVVPHGNRDNEKDSIRKDSSTAQLSIIRLLLSIVTFLELRLATADIKGAYLQSGPIQRTIFVRPPPEWVRLYDHRGKLWKLTKLPYGIVEAGRQWQKTIEQWMLADGGLQRVFGINQLFIRRDKLGRIVLIVAKVTEDFLIGGKLQYIHEFLNRLQDRFRVGKIIVDKRFHFNGCEIEQDIQGNIRTSMLRYLDRLRPIKISRSRRKQRDHRATDDEHKQYRALAGTLLYLGNGVLPTASFVVSLMQQRIANLSVQHLIDANEMLKELLTLKPWITFRRPRNVSSITYCSFSDASHPKHRDYGQTGIICGLRIRDQQTQSSIFHVIDWTSHKQCRVSYSSFGAEILAAATGDDRGYFYKSAINSLLPHLKTKHELIVDSHGLYDTITTLHESKEYRLRPTVQRIRNSFEGNELEILRWIPGTLNIADALTKRNIQLAKMINIICTDGYLAVNMNRGYAVDSSLWQ